MGATYLELTNELLVAFNEVELSEADFPIARGAQKRAKNSIKSVVNEINQQVFNWPFNAVEKTIILAPGQEEYNWPDDFHTVDWNSFQIQKSEEYNIGNQKLLKTARDEWYANHRDTDQDVGLTGISIPTHVFRTHGNGFGVTPSPDKAYTIKYRYFSSPIQLINAADRTTIPEQYTHVIIAGASSYMNIFRDNVENMQLIDQKYKGLLSNMQRVLLNVDEKVRDTRIRF